MIKDMNPTFEKTVDVLVKAFFNDTLVHGDCCACAVGNLVAEGKGYSYKREVYDDNESELFWADKISPRWRDVFMTEGCNSQYKRPERYEGEAKDEIDATGYAWHELARIEHAFEMAAYGKDEDEWMFNGLMAVVDVLADIHGIDLTQKEQAKLLFVK